MVVRKFPLSRGLALAGGQRTVVTFQYNNINFIKKL